MQPYRFIFTADVHGNTGQFVAAYKRAKQLGLDGIFFGGDIAPKEGNDRDGASWKPGHTTRTPESQLRFYEETMLPLFSVANLEGFDVVALMGNDDFKINETFLQEESARGDFTLLHDSAYQLPNGLHVVGMPWVALIPFLQKDWEKQDMSDPTETEKEQEDRLKQGYHILRNGEAPIDFNDMPSNDSLESHLQRKILPLADPSQTVYLFHCPPYGGNLDQTRRRGEVMHLGSSAILKFFEQHNAHAGFFGHIHETVAVSGQYTDTIGETVLATAGNSPHHYPSNNFRNYRYAVDVLVVSAGEKVNVKRETIFFDEDYTIVAVR